MKNQLKETELRIGNTILINGNMYNLELPDLNLIANRNGKSTYSPIHLTEDILVKLGFEKTANPRELKYGGYSILLLNEIRFVICNYIENPPSVKVSTLHQLQNLFFSLCGEELTFKK